MATNTELMPERDDTTGRYIDEYSRESFIEAIQALDGFATTSEVATHVDCIRETAYKKLKRMEQNGEVHSRASDGTLLWMVNQQ